MNTTKYTVFTAYGCEWSMKLVQLMTKKKLNMNVISVRDNEMALKTLAKVGVNSVPQVFVQEENGHTKHLGGYEDMMKLIKKGEVNN